MNQFDRSVLAIGIEKTLANAIEACIENTAHNKEAISLYSDITQRITNGELSKDEISEVHSKADRLNKTVRTKIHQNKRFYINILGDQYARNHWMAKDILGNVTVSSQRITLESMYLNKLHESSVTLHELEAMLVELSVVIYKQTILRG